MTAGVEAAWRGLADARAGPGHRLG